MSTTDISPIEQLQRSAGDATAFLKALANEHRLMILCSLIEEELSVSELNERVKLSQSALSQHLASLRKTRMVATRRESQTIYYRLNCEKTKALIGTLHQLFCPDL